MILNLYCNYSPHFSKNTRVIEKETRENRIFLNVVKTNNNSAKPIILRQIFRGFINNNRTHNEQQKSINKKCFFLLYNFII